MAVTNKQQAAWIEELIEIKADIDELNRRKHEIGKKLGFGTFRHAGFPLLKIVVGRGSSGFVVGWKSICESLCRRYKLDINQEQLGHRTQKFRKPTVSVQGDTAAPANPNLKRVA